MKLKEESQLFYKPLMQASTSIVDAAYKISQAYTTQASVDDNDNIKQSLEACMAFMAKSSKLGEFYDLYQQVAKNLVV